MPFHESLLWYDAPPRPGALHREKGANARHWCDFGRALLDPPSGASEETRRRSSEAVTGIRQALTLASSLSAIAQGVEDVLPEDLHKEVDLEDDERRSWMLGAEPEFVALSERISRHAAGVVTQEGASGPARLWQLRTVLALGLGDRHAP